MSELVSVVIPSYGGGEFLRRTVDSVLGQTYQDIEVIVVDDNGVGTENQKRTAEQMKVYEDNPKVHYVCHEVNKNGSAARNTGVKYSHGDYIALLDDDDEFYPDNIERQMEVMSSLDEDYALTYCGIRSFVGDKMDHEFHPAYSGSLLYEVLTHTVVIGSSSLLIKRSVWNELEGFDESFQRHQDWEFTARVCATYKVKAVDHIGVKRHIIMRNSPKNPYQTLQYRNHYLEKMKPLIERFSPKEQKFIVMHNLLDVCVQYLKAKQYRGFFKLYSSIQPGFYGIEYMFRRFMFAVKRGKI